MYKVGDTVIVSYNHDSFVQQGSIVDNLEGSICMINKVFKDPYHKPYYSLKPVELQIKRKEQYYPMHLNFWWRDEFLAPYEEEPLEINNMDLFLDE